MYDTNFRADTEDCFHEGFGEPCADTLSYCPGGKCQSWFDVSFASRVPRQHVYLSFEIFIQLPSSAQFTHRGLGSDLC